MNKHVDPARDNPDYDWRAEVNWPHVKRLALLHGFYWAFGAAQIGLYKANLLEGLTKTLIGLLDYAIWAILLVWLFPIVSRVRYYEGANHVVSGPTFLILFLFMGSLFAYILLLDFVDLDTIELFPNPETSIQVEIFTLLAGAFVLGGFAVAWQATARTQQLVAWIKVTHPEKWNALDWTLRQIGVGLAIEKLRHQGLQDDGEFQRRYNELKHLKRRMIVLIIIGSISMGIVVYGTSFGGWSW